MLDHLRPTVTRLGGLPAWFLRLSAPVFFQHIAYIFNHSLATSTIPQLWKQSSIILIPKSLPPKQHADFQPISITPVLTRIIEKTVVLEFLYPILLSLLSTVSFSDQFAFRPTCSPCAVIISLFNTITNMLLSHSSVTVISLDFSKAFDKVRHSALLEKMAHLDRPVNFYNWLVDFFGGHTHCTVYRGETSTLKSITASNIQGSGIGPASYVMNASDLDVLTPVNELCKFADDKHFIIPAMNVESWSAEIDHVELWAIWKNLTLNRKKSPEIVFVDTRSYCISTNVWYTPRYVAQGPRLYHHQ